MDENKAQHYTWAQLPTDSPMAMLRRRRIIGEKMMISEVFLEKGCVVAAHSHENEQFCCLMKGALKFEIGSPDSKDKQTYIVRAGEVIHFPSWVPHSAEAVEDSLVLDLFSPPSATTGIDQKS